MRIIYLRNWTRERGSVSPITAPRPVPPVGLLHLRYSGPLSLDMTSSRVGLVFPVAARLKELARGQSESANGDALQIQVENDKTLPQWPLRALPQGASGRYRFRVERYIAIATQQPVATSHGQ